MLAIKRERRINSEVNLPRLALRLIPGVILAGLMVWGAVLYFKQGEPVFRGKRLSEWRTQFQGADPGRREEAAEAMRRIGTNQFSHLSRLIRARDSTFKEDLFYFLNQQSWTRFESAGDKHARGYFEIEMLGPGAMAMIPTLTGILNQGEKPGEAQEAAEALAKIGGRGVPALRKALESEKDRVRAAAAGAFGEFEARGERYVPLLLTALRDRDLAVRANAAAALGKIHQRAPDVVPALIARLSDPALAVRRCSTKALGEFRELAADAVPLLLQSARDRDSVVRDNAIFALRRIDPQAAAIAEK